MNTSSAQTAKRSIGAAILAVALIAGVVGYRYGLFADVGILSLTRQTTDAPFSQDLVTIIFAAKAQETVFGPVGTSGWPFRS